MPIKSIFLCLLVARIFAADAASGDGATGITMAAGWLDEARILAAMGKGALGNCFLTSIRIGGFDTCSTPLGIPMFCVRMRNNVPSNLMEATGRRQHYALQTVMSAAFIKTWSKTQSAQPTNKKIGQDSSSVGGASSSGRVQARTLGTPFLMETAKQLATWVTGGTLCFPTSVQGGYIYFADGDETPGGSIWRSIISPYYLNGMTSGISFYAKGMEVSGLCSLDTNFMVCYGGFGTKYPTSGDIAAGSPALRLITGMWRAQEIHSAPAGTYGPYDTSLGSPIHAMMHLPTSMVGGSLSLLPPYSPGSYMQWLYPGVGAAPVGHPDMWCTPLGIGPGTSPMAMNQMLSETVNKTWMEEDTLAFAYWSRWTCCNWCRFSADEAVRHMIPEMGFLPVLTRIP